MILHFLEKRAGSMNILSEIIGKSYMLYVMAGVFFLGIISRFFLNMAYRSLLKDIGNLPTPRSKILKQIKLKYESCDKLDMQISNTEAFVRKNLYEHRACGISLRAIEKILGQAMFFGVLVGVSTVIFAVFAELENRVVIVHIATTLLGAALLFNYDKLSDISYKRQVVETGLVDFLENHLQMHLMAAERGEDLSDTGSVTVLQSEENNNKEVPIDDNRIIEEVLKEFFG